MPKRKQKSVTIPTWAWELVKEEFERHKEDYLKRKPPIKSPTKLVTSWIEEKCAQQ